MVTTLELAKYADVSEKIIELLIQKTKNQKIVWNNVRLLNNIRLSTSLYRYQQMLLKDKCVIDEEQSYFATIKEMTVFCLNFTNLKTDIQSTHICIFQNKTSRLKRLVPQTPELVIRLSNLIHFSNLTHDDLMRTMELGFLKSVYDELSDENLSKN